MVVTTIVLGVAQATFTPFYTAEVPKYRLKVAVLAILLVAGIGWLFTGSLHRHILASLKPLTTPAPGPQPNPPAAVSRP